MVKGRKILCEKILDYWGSDFPFFNYYNFGGHGGGGPQAEF